MSLQDNQKEKQTTFTLKGLKNVEQAVFSRRNLIIGKNGSGKTRFLKALEQEKKLDDSKRETVITLYFSEIQAFYNAKKSEMSVDNVESSSQEIYPFDLLLEREESTFYDFLKAMEDDKAAFLENILSVLSMQGTKKSVDARRTIDDLNSLLVEFIDKRIQIDQAANQIYIEKIEESRSVRSLLLKEGLEELSPGELMLFYLCVFLMIIKRNYPEGVVLIIDEPELHLHPRALVKMILMLTEFPNIAELWIASHSLFLVPLFEFEEIVFMEQSIVNCRNSQMYRELYDSLVGLENINLFEFLKSLDNWQYYQFIAECFCLPVPVEKVDEKDEQFRKLLYSIRERLQGEPIRMLDYGAGKCRIWECMQLLSDSDPEKSQVIYTAYEPYPEEQRTWPFRLYTDFSDICKDKKQFQVIVLMNVLHEIEGRQWEETFQNIKKVLDDEGVLIFLEVLSLTKGEQPYGNDGYLVLQNEQVKVLFGGCDIINIRLDSKEKSNCWMITKKQVENVTKDTIIASIAALRDSSYNTLRAEYYKRIEYAHGDVDKQQKQMPARKYAFLSQQYINALLAYDMLKKGNERTKKGAYISSKPVIRPPYSPARNMARPLIKVTGVKDSPI